MKIHTQSGNSILVVLVMLFISSISTLAYLSSSGIFHTSAARNFGQQQSYYMAHSTKNFAVQAAHEYLGSTTKPNDTDLTKAIETALIPIMPGDYEITDVSAEIMKEPIIGPIPSGHFKGMEATLTDVKFKYRVSLKSGGERKYVSDVEAVISLSEVSMFQFLYFSDLHRVIYAPGAASSVLGHFHANGDICYGSGAAGDTLIGKITSNGMLLHSNHPSCAPYRTTLPTTNSMIANSADFTSSVLFGGYSATDPKFPQNGCIDCNGTQQKWMDFALSYFDGQVLDVAHSVPRLSLPVPTEINAQVGSDGTAEFTGKSNRRSLRFVVDPVNTIDNDELKKAKFSYKADVRIIDGVWYVRDLKDPNNWPGIPVWSDHPGEFTDAWGNQVGQRTLAKTMGWGAGSEIPRRYSYYEYREDLKALNVESGSDFYGTISYGTLARSTTPTPNTPGEGLGIAPHWKPGQVLARPALGSNAYNNQDTVDKYAVQTININSLCSNPSTGAGRPMYPGVSPDPVDKPSHSDGVAIYPVLPTTSGSQGEIILPFTDTVKCDTGGTRPTPADAQPNISSSILNATRSGFHDPHLAVYHTILNADYPVAATDPAYRNHILPINFDTEQFQLALMDTTRVGELGWIFANMTDQKRNFNGIVFISATWPGSNMGYNPEGAPDLPPTLSDGVYDSPADSAYVPSSPGDTNQIDLTHPQQIRTLPFQLCSQTTTLAGENYDETVGSAGGVARFAVPDCSSYPSDIKSYPNAIRIFNGQKISSTPLTNGLSIVSNLPVYVLGDYNTNSDTSNFNSQPWLPTLIAGDQISIQSNGWDDLNALFTVQMRSISSGTSRLIGPNPKRKAESTTYNTAMISGWAMHEGRNIGGVLNSSNEGMHTFPAMIEDWIGQTMTVNGSIILGFYPVYNRSGRYYTSSNWPSDTSTGDFKYIPYGTYRSGARIINHDKHFKIPKNQPPGSPTFPVSAIKSWKIK